MSETHDRSTIGTFEPKDDAGDLYRAILDGLKEFRGIDGCRIQREDLGFTVYLRNGCLGGGLTFHINESSTIGEAVREEWILTRLARIHRQIQGGKHPGPGATWGNQVEKP